MSSTSERAGKPLTDLPQDRYMPSTGNTKGLKILAGISVAAAIASALLIWATSAWRYKEGSRIQTEIDYNGVLLGAAALLSGFVLFYVLMVVAEVGDDLRAIREKMTERESVVATRDDSL